ncbi:thiamine pyrophosphate-dependent dehydrogenase E1 component subunit alpha [Patescibacteria group bacterium]|nr:thiamine pyrophosphate-dependent dehydrogenase E1 component subunit alpha [Patescibacteria group bacterium]
MKDANLELYKKMYLIRATEEKIRQCYPDNEIKTPVHLAMGEEAIAAGVCYALGPTDQVFATYRNHGVYLAMTNETDRFFAELYGKQTGLSKGKAGSMHIMSPDENLLGTSAIVASMIPVAVGAALTNQYKNNKRSVAVFFGDGAVDEGVFWESLNFACLRQLPIIFVYENNQYAINSHVSTRHGYRSLAGIVSRFDCPVFQSDTTDAEAIYHLTKNALRLQARSAKPVFIHLQYYRYLEHVGVNYDFEFGHRDKKEYQKWWKIDPVGLQRKKLLRFGLKDKELIKIEAGILNRIEASVRSAKQAPPANPNELRSDVYYE